MRARAWATVTGDESRFVGKLGGRKAMSRQHRGVALLQGKGNLAPGCKVNAPRTQDEEQKVALSRDVRPRDTR